MSKKRLFMGCGILTALVLCFLVFSGIYAVSAYNTMVDLDETVKRDWSQVENVYQRRMDLIPNLVETVKGYATHEKETFAAVTEARAKAGGSFNISKDALSDPAVFSKFQQAQSSLGSALSRLMVVMEKYPELKANQNFLSLQSQLEGTENRIAVERNRFNKSAKYFNVYIKKFPKVFIARMFGFSEKSYFKSEKGAEKAPKVKF